MFELTGCEPLVSPMVFWACVLFGAAISTFSLLTRGILGGAIAIFLVSCGTSYLIGGGEHFWLMVKLHSIWNSLCMFTFIGFLRVQSFMRHGRIRFAETDLTGGDA